MTTTWTDLPKPSLGGEFGPELISNGDFSSGSSGWSVGSNWSITTKASHTPGNTAMLLSPLFPVLVGETYRVFFVVSDLVSGDLDVSCDGESIQAPTDDSYAFDFVATSTGNFRVTSIPSNDFNGSLVSVSAKQFVTDIWTTIVKPSPLSWTKKSKASGTSYTDLPKPTVSTTTSYGTPYGMLLALLKTVTITSDNWTDVAEHSANWTKVPKAT